MPFQQPQPIEDVTKSLENMLIEKVGHDIPKVELDLVVQIAKEMLVKNHPEGVDSKKLTPSELQATLDAALEVGKAIELDTMRRLQQECKQLLDKIIDPNNKEDKDNLKFLLKNKLNALNNMDPNPERRKEREKLFKPENIDQLIRDMKSIKDKWEKEPSSKDNKVKVGDEEERMMRLVEEAMTNLLGYSPKGNANRPNPNAANIGNPTDVPNQVDTANKNNLERDTEDFNLDNENTYKSPWDLKKPTDISGGPSHE